MSLERSLHLLGASLVVALARGLALFLMAYALTALVKRMSGEARHLIWLGVTVAFLLIPLAWLLLPSIHVGALIPRPPAALHRLVAAPLLSAREFSGLVEQASGRVATAGLPAPILSKPIWLALPAAWLVGVLVLAARLTAGLARLRRVAAEATGCLRLQGLAGRLGRALRIRRQVAVLLSPHCAVPFTFGVLRPVILLPDGTAGWPVRRLRSVLIHELAHVRRHDVPTQAAAYSVCLLLWFLPPVWLAFGGLRREAESCCDQQVINRGIRGPAYARQIVELIHHSQGGPLLPCVASTLGGNGLLRQRVRNVLRLAPGRRPFGFRGALQALPVLLFCLLPALLLAASTRPADLGPQDPLFGTWINEEYDRSDRFLCAKVVFSPDGRKLNYRHIADAEPCLEINCSTAALWIGSGGDRSYKLRLVAWLPSSGTARAEGFALCRIGRGGNILECAAAQRGYPLELSSAEPDYRVYRKK